MLDRIVDRAVAALTWWVDGLWLGVPRSVRDKLLRPKDRAVVCASSDGALRITAYRSGQPAEEWTVPTAPGGVLLPDRCDLAPGADITLVLPDTVALTRRLTLPASAEPALRSVLRHELDRITPFAPDEIVFDFHVLERRADKLGVIVTISRSATLVGLLATLERHGLRATVVTGADAVGNLLVVNLLRRRPQLRLPFAMPPIGAPAAVAAGLALLAALYLPLVRYDAVLDGHQQEVAAVREQAVAARAALEQREVNLAEANFLAQRRAEYVPPIALLLELTEHLPDHAWLARLSFTRDGVQLQGESIAASELLQIVESMERLRGAQFHAPVARSGESNREQFTITAAPVRFAP